MAAARSDSEKINQRLTAYPARLRGFTHRLWMADGGVEQQLDVRAADAEDAVDPPAGKLVTDVAGDGQPAARLTPAERRFPVPVPNASAIATLSSSTISPIDAL